MAKKFTMENIKISDANRNISRAHVERLKELLKKHGYVNSRPIIVDPDGLIIDGQHRYLACKELKITPTIVVEESFDLTPVLNSSQLNWSMADYVKYYATKGYEHFVIMEQICKSKNLKPGVVYNIVFNKTLERTGMSRQVSKFPLKDGTFKFPDISEKGLAKLERKIDRVIHLISLLDLPKTDRLIIAISRLAKDGNFSFDTMEAKIAYQRARIYRCSTIQEYMQMLANIYNNKNPKKVVV